MMVFNDILDKGLRMTLWVWLPFYVLPMLFREVLEKYRKKSGK
jgi:hypothetical protein